MREIKFRVWLEFEFKGQLRKEMASEANWFVLSQTGMVMQYGSMRPLKNCQEYKKVIPLFYTGRRDKQGKEIYEGDICRLTWTIEYDYKSVEEKDVAWVAFSEGSYIYRASNGSVVNHLNISAFHEQDTEIIGNIYENGGLLETN